MIFNWTGFDTWMAERDPDFAAKAVTIIELELQPPTDGPTFCVDEKPGIGIHLPGAPSQPAAPGQPARREFEYERHGTADLLAAFAVDTGRPVWCATSIAPASSSNSCARWMARCRPKR